MSRTIFSVLLVGALLSGIALAFFWYLSFVVGRPSMRDVTTTAVNQAVLVGYETDGFVRLEASTEIDAYVALGFVQGRDYAWNLIILRQTALGRLGEWFGRDVAKVDHFARQLGFAANARAAYRELTGDDLDVLDAFARGVNAALDDPNTRLTNEFVLFDIDPMPWEGWHTLAIEQLLAWTSLTPDPGIPKDSTALFLKDFHDRDLALQSWLQLRGGEMSAAWAASDSSSTTYMVRLVYGASALPLFMPVEIVWDGLTTRGVVVLGTPFFPVVASERGVHVTLLSSQRSYEPVEIDSATDDTITRYERIADTHQNEHLTVATTLRDRLLIGLYPKNDSTRAAVALSWDGFSGLTDWPAWRATVNTARIGGTSHPAFRLIEGNGIVVDGSGGKSLKGKPVVSIVRRDLVFAADSRLTVYAGYDLASNPFFGSPDDLGYTSSWARQLLPIAMSLIDPSQIQDQQVEDALDYLRNWDFRYDMSSIGGALFDAWMMRYRGSEDMFGLFEAPVDSSERAQVRQVITASLIRAVREMAAAAGPDLAQWRLEEFRRGRRYFPVWSYDPVKDQLPALNQSRYAPIEIPQRGHVTTPAWQPSLDQNPLGAPSHVVVWGQAGRTTSMAMRPDYQIGTGFIARHIAGPPKSTPIVTKSAPESAIVLLPKPD